MVELTKTRLSLKPSKKTLRAAEQTSHKLRLDNRMDSARKIRANFKSGNRKVTVRKAKNPKGR